MRQRNSLKGREKIFPSAVEHSTNKALRKALWVLYCI